MKLVRRPLLLTISLLLVIGLIYNISSSHSTVEGLKPINLNPGFLSQEKSSVELGAGYDESILIDDKEVSTDHNENEVSEAAEAGDVGQAGDETDEETDPESVKNGKSAKGKSAESKTGVADDTDTLSDPFGITETPFMPKMANETLKAQLGNAAWKLFHTILARYPDKPTVQEQTTLSQYIQLFGQVYPCGDCARHFQGLLKKYPPQTKSRKTAALWGCGIHNRVNERLGKPEYDCTTVLEDYDCGCGADEEEIDITLGNKSLKGIELEVEGEQGG